MSRGPVKLLGLGAYWDGKGMYGGLDVIFDGRIVHSSRMDEAAWPVFLERILVWKHATLGEDTGLSAAMPDGKPFHLLLPGRTGPGLVMTRSGASFLAEAGSDHALVPVADAVRAVRGVGEEVFSKALATGAGTGEAYATWRAHA